MNSGVILIPDNGNAQWLGYDGKDINYTKDASNQLASAIEQTDKSKLAIQQSLAKLELLKKSLMQEYFG